MNSARRRVSFLLGVGVLAVPLTVAAVAYGCTAQALITLSPAAAPSGGTVTVTGKYFGTHDAQDVNSNQPVLIRLGSVTGPVLASAAPTGTERSFTVQVTVPDVAPGATFFTATQASSTGTRVYGTPARQTFEVTPAPARSGDDAGSGPTDAGRPAMTVPDDGLPSLSLSTARRYARMQVRRDRPGARRLRTTCSRRTATSAVCRVRYVLGAHRKATKLVVTSQSTAAAW